MIELEISSSLVPYPQALEAMEKRVDAIINHEKPEKVWFLEHPPLYTAGTSANQKDLIDAKKFPVFDAGRGGQYTYHGPMQRIGYLMLDLKTRGNDIRQFIFNVEELMIKTIAEFDVIGERREGRVGIWVASPDGSENKIGAIGVRVRRGVTFHGFALNVAPDLSHFTGIVPCGIRNYGVTSLRHLGINASLTEVDSALIKCFGEIFGESLTPFPAS